MARKKVRNLIHNGNEFRSGFELLVAKDLEARGVLYEYETVEIGYQSPSQRGECLDCGSENIVDHRIYTPDFLLPNGIFIETKGRFTSFDRTKMQNVIKSNPDKNVRMVFMTDNFLTKKKATRYSTWCKRNGIQFAFKLVPQSWIDE